MILYFSASSTCPDGWFRCNNGRCIPLISRCDGYNECGNGDDERNCCEFNCFSLISIMFVSHLDKQSLLHEHGVYYKFGECFIQNYSLLYIEYVVKFLLHK